MKTLFIYWFNLIGYELGRNMENFNREDIKNGQRGRHNDMREMIANGFPSDSVCS